MYIIVHFGPISSLLGPDFNINDYENWISWHPNCNQRKSAKAYEGLPFLKTLLDRCFKLKPEAKKIEDGLKKKPKKAKLLLQILQALEQGVISEEDISVIVKGNMEAFDELNEENLEEIKRLITGRKEYQGKKEKAIYMEKISKSNSKAISELKNQLGEDWVTGVSLRSHDHKVDNEFTFHKYIQNKYDKELYWDIRITPVLEAGNVVAKLRFGNDANGEGLTS